MQKFQSDDVEEADFFGMSVAIDGNSALVGAMRESTAANMAGSVYAFEWNGSSWVQIQKFQSSDAEATDFFGRSVALDGKRALVGAMRESEAANNAGSVYAFEWNGSSWIQSQKFQSSDIEGSDNFGFSVAVDGKRALVGAHNGDTTANNSGAAYYFEHNGTAWNQVQKFQSNDVEEGDSFGSSVTLDGNRVIVGASREDAVTSNAGAVYTFELGKNNTWTSIATGEMNDGSYTWTLPSDMGVEYSVRVGATNNLGITTYDISSPISVDNSAPDLPTSVVTELGIISHNTPTVTFDLSDPDGGDLIKYQIKIDNNADFSSPEVDFTEAAYSAAPRSGVEFTSPPLESASYYLRVRAIDDSGAEGAWKVLRMF